MRTEHVNIKKPLLSKVVLACGISCLLGAVVVAPRAGRADDSATQEIRSSMDQKVYYADTEVEYAGHGISVVWKKSASSWSYLLRNNNAKLVAGTKVVFTISDADGGLDKQERALWHDVDTGGTICDGYAKSPNYRGTIRVLEVTPPKKQDGGYWGGRK